jgi:hypothetical protein
MIRITINREFEISPFIGIVSKVKKLDFSKKIIAVVTPNFQQQIIDKDSDHIPVMAFTCC